jgi:hypothetical protein
MPNVELMHMINEVTNDKISELLLCKKLKKAIINYLPFKDNFEEIKKVLNEHPSLKELRLKHCVSDPNNIVVHREWVEKLKELAKEKNIIFKCNLTSLQQQSCFTAKYEELGQFKIEVNLFLTIKEQLNGDLFLLLIVFIIFFFLSQSQKETQKENLETILCELCDCYVKSGYQEDHKEVCAKERRNCTNQINGCNFFGNKSEIQNHLKDCKVEYRCPYIDCQLLFKGRKQIEEHLLLHEESNKDLFKTHNCLLGDCLYITKDPKEYKMHRCKHFWFTSSCCKKKCDTFEIFLHDPNFHEAGCPSFCYLCLGLGRNLDTNNLKEVIKYYKEQKDKEILETLNN